MGGGQRWQVTAREGLVVRQGQQLSSAQVPERLPAGAIVEELQLAGNELCFALLTSSGPCSGWVSVAEGDRQLLVRRLGTPEARYQRASGAEKAQRRRQREEEEADVAAHAVECPLEGWAFLEEMHLPRPVTCAAETGGSRIDMENLPPIDELESASVETLVDYLGFSERAAFEFAHLEIERKRQIIAESKALISMSDEQRKDAIMQLRNAWPSGPMPSFAPDTGGPQLLPRGTCFPLSRYLAGGSGAPDAHAWGLDSSAARADKGFFKRETAEPLEAQKEFLRSLRSDVVCTGATVVPEGSTAVQDPCYMEGAVDVDQMSATISAKGALRPDDVVKYLNRELKSRICFLDGGMSSKIKGENLGEADYRGDRFKTFRDTDASGKAIELVGNDDMLVLTKPGLIFDIHKEYYLAGSDICRTNSFCSTSIGQAKYKMQKIVYELNKASAQLAKKAASEVTKTDHRKPRLVAGVMGPIDGEWEEVVAAYDDAIRGLVDGGADILLLDRVASTLNAKAAIAAVEMFFAKLKKKPLPLMIIAGVGSADKTSAGSSVLGFAVSVRNARPLALGVAASTAESYRPLPGFCSTWCAASFGSGALASSASELASGGLLNFVGGDAGTTVSDISTLIRKVKDSPARKLPAPSDASLQLSGLEACMVKPEEGFQVIGQRCTSMGCARFKKLINTYKATLSESSFKAAIDLCASQCDRGADILDINLDMDSEDALPASAVGLMTKFITACVANPKIARLPLMISSSELDVIKEGLQCAPGKCIVNGICLMLGQEEFLRVAKECQNCGAAVVVLAISEHGPAETHVEKVRVCQRSYKLLRSKLDFPAEDIIFDCGLTMIGTPETVDAATNFINAVAEVKQTCPGVAFVAGVSNLSLPFRGLNKVRDALHAVFLHHAIPKGVNLAIAEPGCLPRYTNIDVEMRTLCEEVVLNRSRDGNHLERFMAYVNFHSNSVVCLAVGNRSPPPSYVTSVEAKSLAQQYLEKRKISSTVQKKQYFQSLQCRISCNASPTKAEAGAGLPDLCRSTGFVDRGQVTGTIKVKGSLRPDDVAKYFNAELTKRICVLDGDIAAALKAEKLSEADYRGVTFKGSAVPLQGNEDILVLSKPELVVATHKQYLNAGVDICGTNTLNANAISQKAYRAEASVYDMNKVAAQLAKKAAAEVTMADVDKPRFVAGVIGPTSCSLSDPTDTTWDDLVEAYIEQVRGLVDGGVDLLEIKMIADTINAKAAIFAVDTFFEQAMKDRLPLILTVTIAADRTLSGQSIEAFFISVKHAKPLSVGINCAGDATAVLKSLAGISTYWCHVSPDIGGDVAGYAGGKLLNFVGGGKGASPSSLADMAKKVKAATPRSLPALTTSGPMQLSGLEPYFLRHDHGCQVVSQRCNVMGSSVFKVLVEAYKVTKQGSKWDAAMEFCARQIEKNADILDFNFDSDVIDGKAVMGKFMRLCAKDSRVASVPFMLGSVSWSVIEEGLKSVQGKSIVNAISLMSGEEEFLQTARACQKYGAAVVVLAIETQDEATFYPDKVRICQRSYQLLRTRLNFPAEDIIFDCGVFPLNGEEGASSPTDCIDAMGEIKRTCPSVSFIAGVSNLSLPFRGANVVRDALHSVFLYQAIQNGLNLAIVNLGNVPCYTDIEAGTVKVCEDAVWTDGSTARADLFDFAASLGAGMVQEIVSAGQATEEETAVELKCPELHRGATRQFKQKLAVHDLIQATGTINASIFQTFGSKAHAAKFFHSIAKGNHLRRIVMFSSISVWMGQGGSGPVTGASSLMDGLAMLQRQQQMMTMSCTVLWGAIGEIGLRLTIYGSRDVFAQFDLGQKLIGPADTQFLEKQIMTCYDVLEFIGMAYLDQTWQNTLSGVTAAGGLDARKTFADM